MTTEPETEQPPATQIVLIRHGESIANAQRLMGGPRSCGGLTGTGRDQVESLARRVKATGELDGCVLYSSHFRRAVETATIVGQAIGAGDPTIDDGFGELDPGEEADGWSYEQLVETYGVPSWPPELSTPPWPGAETVGALRARVGAALERVVAAHPGRLVVVGTHGGVVDAAVRFVVGGDAALGDLWTTNSSLTGITRTPWETWRLDRYNDAAHLLDW